MTDLLRASAVGFERYGEQVFEPLDIQLSPGMAVVLTGRNGAGKTTLLRLLAGILTPSCGTLEIDAAVAFVGHLPAVKGDLTCRENLQYEQSLGPACQPVAEALARVGLAGLGIRPARALSAGQKKRLGLARLLVRFTPVWLLDEPYASLDDHGCATVDRLISAQLDHGGAVILATHQRQPRIAPERIWQVIVSASGETTE
ncbi:MAG: heme ABC exporter ATP-binding protein CcmA [Wenzhouxiangellaceae bacterium]|nr:heme ABC exporter ATP-binding protein CcmA [Wenzhouxiangellaceae bacterium]